MIEPSQDFQVALARLREICSSHRDYSLGTITKVHAQALVEQIANYERQINALKNPVFTPETLEDVGAAICATKLIAATHHTCSQACIEMGSEEATHENCPLHIQAQVHEKLTKAALTPLGYTDPTK